MGDCLASMFVCETRMLSDSVAVYVEQDQACRSGPLKRWPNQRDLSTSVLCMTAVVCKTSVVERGNPTPVTGLGTFFPWRVEFVQIGAQQDTRPDEYRVILLQSAAERQTVDHVLRHIVEGVDDCMGVVSLIWS